MNKINRYLQFLMLLSIFIIYTTSSYAVPILRLDNDQTVSIQFDNRFTQDSSKTGTKTFYIYNDGNTSMTITSVTVSSQGSGISMSIYSYPYSIPAGSSDIVTVSYSVSSSVSPDKYTGVVTVNTLNAGSGTMKLVLDVTTLIPAKLDTIGERSITIEFDKPKGSQDCCTGRLDISLRNVGDSILSINSIYVSSSLGSGISITVSDDYSRSISPRSSGMTNLIITAPTSVREDTYKGRIAITTSKERRYGTDTDYFDIRVTIKHGIKMEITSSSIDFGDTPIYKQKNNDITISETLGYKSINNIRLNKIDGEDKWLGISPMLINGIDAGSSSTINIGLLFEGDATLYQKYDWTYTISTNNAGSKNLKVTARNVPPDVKPLLDILCNQKYNGNSNTKEIAEKMCSSLTYGDISARNKMFKLDELISLIAIANSAVNLLDSYLIAEEYINQAKYDNAYENILKGVVSARIIKSYSEKVSNDKIKNDITLLNQKSNNLMDGLLEKEKEFYESEKASLKSLQSMTAYERLSEMYGIIGNEQERKRFDGLAKEKFEEYNNRINSAKNSRLDAENISKEVEDSYLSKWGGMHILINPFYYSKVSLEHDLISSKYKEAIQNYENAGESIMASKTQKRLNDINSLFNKRYSIFFLFTGFYAVVFLGVLARSTKAMTAYVRDTSETRMGDNFL